MTAPANSHIRMVGDEHKMVVFEYDLDGLAGSATFNGDWIDLFDYPGVTQFSINFQGTASASCTMTIQGGHDGSGGSPSPSTGSNGTTTGSSQESGISAAGARLVGVPTGRWARAQLVNGATPQAAGDWLTLTLMFG